LSLFHGKEGERGKGLADGEKGGHLREARNLPLTWRFRESQGKNLDKARSVNLPAVRLGYEGKEGAIGDLGNGASPRRRKTWAEESFFIIRTKIPASLGEEEERDLLVR